MKIRTLVKRILAELISLCGVLFLIERSTFSHKALVLMYHRVIPSTESIPYYVQPGMYVSTTSFEKQIAFLQKRFNVVFFDDLTDKVRKGEDIGGMCAITLDDGWRDNYTSAFPLLARYNLPSTIYLTTGYVGTDKLFWPEEIFFYLDQIRTVKLPIAKAPESLIRFNNEIDRYTKEGREVFFDRAIALLKKFSPRERDEILGHFRGTCDRVNFPRQMLSWDEAKEMCDSGLVRFGAHTVNHAILDQISLQQAQDEISVSRAEIEQQLGVTVRTFAYPNGNNNDDIRNLLKDIGFDAAVTTRKGLMGVDSPLMEVPRIGVHEDMSNTLPMFRLRILFQRF